MNEKAKKILIGIGTFFVGIFAVIFGATLQGQRNTADKNRARAEELKGKSASQQSENRGVVKAARKQQSNNAEAISGLDEASKIIGKIREKQ